MGYRAHQGGLLGGKRASLGIELGRQPGRSRQMETKPGMSGGCSCGAVRYEASADPVVMLNCHCRDCQRASGAGFAAVVVVAKSALRIEGELRYHETVGESGNVVERGFCPTCGSRV